jgi:hypothetical protein
LGNGNRSNEVLRSLTGSASWKRILKVNREKVELECSRFQIYEKQFQKKPAHYASAFVPCVQFSNHRHASSTSCIQEYLQGSSCLLVSTTHDRRLDNGNIGTALRYSELHGKHHNDDGDTPRVLVESEPNLLYNPCGNIFHNFGDHILQDPLPKSQRSCT